MFCSATCWKLRKGMGKQTSYGEWHVWRWVWNTKLTIISSTGAVVRRDLALRRVPIRTHARLSSLKRIVARTGNFASVGSAMADCATTPHYSRQLRLEWKLSRELSRVCLLWLMDRLRLLELVCSMLLLPTASARIAPTNQNLCDKFKLLLPSSKLCFQFLSALVSRMIFEQGRWNREMGIG